MMPTQETAKGVAAAGYSLDFPANLIARFVKANAPVSFEGMSRDGDVRFSVPMRDVGLSRRAMAPSPMCRTVYFVNLLGEILVRKNIALFAKLLEDMEPKAYDTAVNAYKHRHFGMVIDDNDVLNFQFHISLAQRVLTENMATLFDQN